MAMEFNRIITLLRKERGITQKQAAQELGIRGIRLLRSANSTYRPLPLAGALGEEVIVNSQY